MTIGKKFLGVAGCVLLVGAVTLNATEDSKKQEKNAETIAKIKDAGNKDKAEAGISANSLIKKAYAYIGNLEKYSFEATIVNEDDLGVADIMIYLRHNYKVSVVGPDKIRMDVKGDTENSNIYLKNGTVSIINADKKSYAQVKVSSNIDDALDDLIDTYGVPVPLTQFLYSDMDDDINASTKGYYLGTVFIDKTPCYYVAFPDEKWDVQFWIEKGDTPLIRKVSYVDKKKKGQPRSMVTLHWDITSAIDEKIFDFKAPEGIKQAKVLTLEEAKKLKMKVATKTDAQTKDKK